MHHVSRTHGMHQKKALKDVRWLLLCGDGCKAASGLFYPV